MNPYNYLFLKLYKFGIKLDFFDAKYSAVSIISLFIAINLDFIRKKIHYYPVNLTNYSIAVFVLLFIVNALYFIREKRYEKIIERYKNESKAKSIIGTVCVLIYIVLSVIAPLIF